MKHDWEDELTPEMIDAICNAADLVLPDGVRLAGIGFGKEEDGEGAYSVMPWMRDGDITICDIGQDILGDTKAHYQTAVEIAFGGVK